MTIDIKKVMTVSAFNILFNKQYPGLKIECYRKPHKDHEGSSPNLQVPEKTTFGELNPNMVESTIQIDGEMTVQEFETTMESTYGIHIQVFRKSGNIWLQTMNTDDWTINKQNERGLN